MRGADLIAQGLKSHGIETVFSLSGNQIMPVYDALLDTGTHIIHTRHEGAAVYMAEAAAQVSGKVAVALLTAGPGFANGLSAIYSARESETPILVLTGDSPVARDQRGAFQELDQCAAAAVMAKASFRCLNADGMQEDVRRAVKLATSGRPGPVHIALPDDILRQAATDQPEQSSCPMPDEEEPFTDADAQAVLALINAAERPVIAAGPAFCRPAWKRKLHDLSTRLNVPIIAFESPRGLRAPRLGAFAEIAGQADALITLGKPLNFMLGFADAPTIAQNCRVLQIDADAALLQRDNQHHQDRAVESLPRNPAFAVEHLLAMADCPTHPSNSWKSDVDGAVAYRPPSWSKTAPAQATINSLDIAQAVAKFASAHPDASLIIDGGEIGQWCQATADADCAVINGPSGAIGAGPSYAIGAKTMRPDKPALAVVGDGTAGFYLAEFETAVRENIAVVTIVGNDAKWNAEHQIQLRDYGDERAHSCTLTPARYDLVMADLGGHGECVTSPADLDGAIERAFASGKPACVNVMFDGQAAPAIKRG